MPPLPSRSKRLNASRISSNCSGVKSAAISCAHVRQSLRQRPSASVPSARSSCSSSSSKRNPPAIHQRTCPLLLLPSTRAPLADNPTHARTLSTAQHSTAREHELSPNRTEPCALNVPRKSRPNGAQKRQQQKQKRSSVVAGCCLGSGQGQRRRRRGRDERPQEGKGCRRRSSRARFDARSRAATVEVEAMLLLRRRRQRRCGSRSRRRRRRRQWRSRSSP